MKPHPGVVLQRPALPRQHEPRRLLPVTSVGTAIPRCCGQKLRAAAAAAVRLQRQVAAAVDAAAEAATCQA